MPANRYYLPSPFREGEKVYLEGDEFHHLAHVMRGRVGEAVELVNGDGLLAQARIERIEKRQAELLLTSLISSKESFPRFILAQSLLRTSKLEFILEKCTELGASEIWLFPGERSEKRELPLHQEARLKTVCIGAMKQCGRLFLPSIVLQPPLKEWSNRPGLTYLFGDLRTGALPLPTILPTLPKNQEIVFVVGPEAGLTEHEIGHLETLGALAVSLHSNTLRTETAAIAAAALLGFFSFTKSS